MQSYLMDYPMPHAARRSFKPVLTALLSTLLALPLAAAAAPAGTGAKPSIEQWLLFTRNGRTLVDWASVSPQWLSDGSRFAFVQEKGGVRTAQWVDPESGAMSEFIDPQRFRGALANALGAPKLDGSGLPITAFSMAGDNAIRFAYEGGNYLYDLNQGEVTPVPKGQLENESRYTPTVLRQVRFENKIREQLSPNGRWLATETGNDLGLRSTMDGHTFQLTQDGAERYRWDVSTVVWSADSNLLAAAQVDQRADHHVPIVHWLQPEEQINWLHYPKNGASSPLPAYAIINPLSRQRVALDLTGHENRNVSAIGFRPGYQELILMSNAGDGADSKLYAADVTTGALRQVLEDVGGFGAMSGERGALFGQTVQQSFGALPWAGGEQFLHASDRDGTVSLYSYTYDGKQAARVTPSGAHIHSIVTYDDANDWLYVLFRQPGNRPYDLHLGRVHANGKGFTQITQAEGNHAVTLSPSKKFFIDSHSSVTRPGRVDLLRIDGSLIATLADTGISRLQAAGWVAPEEFTATAADGETILHGTIHFPPGFDPSKRYPVIDAIYNGPQVITRPNNFTGGLTPADRFAQLGFISVMLDSRGTPGRGRAFQEVVYGHMGQHEIPDHVAAIKEIAAQRPYMDLSRVGLSGWSYGGYMTLRGMLLAPDFYQVGVSGAPAVDHMDMMTAQSGIMGYPWNNPEGYAAGSNLLAADKLKGHLLMIHGTSDTNATFSTTMKMVDAFIRAGKPVDFLAMPEMDHYGGFNGDGGYNSTLALYRDGAIARYLVQYLKPEGIDYWSIPLQ